MALDTPQDIADTEQGCNMMQLARTEKSQGNFQYGCARGFGEAIFIMFLQRQDAVPVQKRSSRFLRAEAPLKLPSTEVRTCSSFSLVSKRELREQSLQLWIFAVNASFFCSFLSYVIMVVSLLGLIMFFP